MKKKTIVEGNRVKGKRGQSRSFQLDSFGDDKNDWREENPLNERIIFRPFPVHTKTCIGIGGTMIVEGRAAMLPNFQQRSWTISRSKSKSRAKFRVSRRSRGWACFDACRMGRLEGRTKRSGSTSKGRSESRGTLVERTVEIQAEKGGGRCFHISKSRRMPSLRSIRLLKLRRVNRVAQVSIVKFRSKPFSKLGSVSKWRLAYNPRQLFNRSLYRWQKKTVPRETGKRKNFGRESSELKRYDVTEWNARRLARRLAIRASEFQYERNKSASPAAYLNTYIVYRCQR